MKKISITKVFLVLIVVAAIIGGIVFIIKNNQENLNDNNQDKVNLSNNDFSNLTAKGLDLKYIAEEEKTILDLKIENTTDEIVENETINVQLLDEQDEIVSEIQIYIESLEPKTQYSQPIELMGDLTQLIKKIQLKKVEQTDTNEAGESSNSSEEV